MPPFSSPELDRLTEACGALPPASGNYVIQDFVTNLLLTVLDFQMRTTQSDRRRSGP
jgi:hypothetical protein